MKGRRRPEGRPTGCGANSWVGLQPDGARKKNGARCAPSPLPESVLRYFFAGAAALAGAAPAFAAGAAGVAGGICAGVAALPFAFISAK